MNGKFMLDRQLKHIRISEAVRSDILKGRLTNPLPEMGVLGQRFGTSRITMRNALLHLQEQGVVRIEHGAGTFINPDVLQSSVQSNTELLDMGDLRHAFTRYSDFLTDPDISADAKRRMILIVNSQIEMVRSVLPKKP